jgi:hypothetical protein
MLSEGLPHLPALARTAYPSISGTGVCYGTAKQRRPHNNGSQFLYSAVSLPISPGEIEIAEACSVIFRSTTEFGTITESSSFIPPFTPHFTPRARNNGSLFRYIQEYNGTRHNNGSQFLYYAVSLPISPRELEITEACSVIFRSTTELGTITESSSFIPPFTPHFTRRDRNSGSLFRYIQEYNGTRHNNGIQFLYS